MIAASPISTAIVADAIAKEFNKRQAFETSDVFKLMLNGFKLLVTDSWSDDQDWPLCWQGISQESYDQFMRIMMEPPLAAFNHVHVDIEDLLLDLPSVSEHVKFGVKVHIDWDLAKVTLTKE